MLSIGVKSHKRGGKTMLRELEDAVMTTQEACHYLRISRPTYLKYLYTRKD